MPFEKFEGGGQGRSGSTAPKISLRKSGSLGINNNALEQFFEDSEAAVMYYDEEENQVGIQPLESKDDDENAYTISKSDSGGSITPSAFLKRYDLIPDITTQYTPEAKAVNQNLELVTIDLDNPIGTYGSPSSEEEGEETEA